MPRRHLVTHLGKFGFARDGLITPIELRHGVARGAKVNRQRGRFYLMPVERRPKPEGHERHAPMSMGKAPSASVVVLPLADLAAMSHKTIDR